MNQKAQSTSAIIGVVVVVIIVLVVLAFATNMFPSNNIAGVNNSQNSPNQPVYNPAPVTGENSINSTTMLVNNSGNESASTNYSQ